jgi:hypothetical protein
LVFRMRMAGSRRETHASCAASLTNTRLSGDAVSGVSQ